MIKTEKYLKNYGVKQIPRELKALYFGEKNDRAATGENIVVAGEGKESGREPDNWGKILRVWGAQCHKKTRCAAAREKCGAKRHEKKAEQPGKTGPKPGQIVVCLGRERCATKKNGPRARNILSMARQKMLWAHTRKRYLTPGVKSTK